MAKINMIMQGKGGVGKTFVSASIAQYLESKGQKPLCIDTDPVNRSFHGYKALHVQPLELMTGKVIDPSKFDTLIEWVTKTTDDVVIDNGASSFVPLSHYLFENGIPGLLKDTGHEFLLHTVITGGEAMNDTVSGFAQLTAQFPDSMFVLWLNPYWGPIEYNGKTFENSDIYKKYVKQIAAIVKIPDWTAATFGKDLREVLQKKLTYNEALAMENLFIMPKQRLKMIQRELFGLIDNAKVI